MFFFFGGRKSRSAGCEMALPNLVFPEAFGDW